MHIQPTGAINYNERIKLNKHIQSSSRGRFFVISPATGKTTGIATKRNNYVTAQGCPTLFDNFLKVVKSEQCKAVTLFQDEATSQTGKTQQIATKR